MQKRTLACMAAVGCAAAIAIPSIAFGNARNNTPGTHAAFVAAQKPFVALMNGPSDLTTSGTITPTGDPDGTGSASFTFDITNAADPVAGAQICWDIRYSNLDTVTSVHIHQGAAGVGGGIVVPVSPTSFPNVTQTGTTGCITMDPTLADQIMVTPANFYVNVHTTLFPTGAIRGQLAAGPPPAGETHLLGVPLRAYDSRTVDGPIALNATRTISLATGLDSTGTAPVTVLAVPPGATGALVTLTVTDTSIANGPGGFLKMYSAALGTPPATSSINWAGAGQNVAVTTQVVVDASGQVKITDGANPTNFVVDVIGYTF